MIDEILNPPKKYNPQKVRTPQEIAEERHALRTTEETETIQQRWNEKRINGLNQALTDELLPAECAAAIRELEDLNVLADYDEFKSRASLLSAAVKRHSERTLATIRAIQDRADARAYGQPYVDNIHAIEKALGVQRGKRMTVEQADKQNANPNYSLNKKYRSNCQTCVPTYMLRLTGFDVTAKPKLVGSVSEWISKSHSFDIWQNADGSAAKPNLYANWMSSKGYKRMTPDRYRAFYEEHTRQPGVYVTTIQWRGGGAHATILQRLANGKLVYVEPQSFNSRLGVMRDIAELCNYGKTTIPSNSPRGIMRIDDKLLKQFCTDKRTGAVYDIWSIFVKK